MNRLFGIGLLALALVACKPLDAQPVAVPSGETDSAVRYIHDAEHGVGCWLYGNGAGSQTAAIDCIPDSEYRR